MLYPWKLILRILSDVAGSWWGRSLGPSKKSGQSWIFYILQMLLPYSAFKRHRAKCQKFWTSQFSNNCVFSVIPCFPGYSCHGRFGVFISLWYFCYFLKCSQISRHLPVLILPVSMIKKGHLGYLIKGCILFDLFYFTNPFLAVSVLQVFKSDINSTIQIQCPLKLTGNSLESI